MQQSGAAMPPMRPYEDQGPTILASTLTVTVVAVLTTIARFYVRVKMIRNVGWDDYVMLLAMTLCIAGQCLVIPQVHMGAGKHIDYIKKEDFVAALRLNLISQPIFLFAICFVKVSVGFFLLRIAVGRLYRRLIIGIMVVTQCQPLSLMWDQSAKGTCWTIQTRQALGFLNIILNIITDIAFSVGIPIPMLWGVQMNRRHKASLICILGLGTFATVAALVKLSYLPHYGREGDLLWDSRDMTIWTVVECNVGIVAGNLPCLKPLFRSILVSTYGSGSRKNSQPRYFSDAYGKGTKQRSAVKSYGPLASNKTSEGEYAGHSAAGKSYMLTTIDATNKQTGDLSRSPSGGSSTSGERGSTESDTRLHSKAHGSGGMGNITVTTKVDVTESMHSNDIYESGRTYQRPQAKEMV
ncbi:uncharacterized protein J4E92_009142 [Alternaria infectoria]|uniref:uncharacterized protein n=1 Tax=Alternaria infectoria TaxID=45303 RepID=UPI0022203AEF|nr:uncharacterized protein J4E92_009142 [Alternaria infectoria]KAI4916638.1 hypothetical protein J4E92_009142 [Alternaria infectoria]